MATRVLIFDTNTGQGLEGLDGHHGEAHAARWCADALARIRAEGVDAVAVELVPASGGDDARRGTIGAIARLALEFRERPDGKREPVALNRYPARTPGAEPFRGRFSRQQVAAVPDRIAGALRIVAAPESIAGERQPIRIRRGRMNAPTGQPFDAAEARIARRLAAARSRP